MTCRNTIYPPADAPSLQKSSHLGAKQSTIMSERELHGSNSIDHEVDVVPSNRVQRVGNRWGEAALKRLCFLCIATYVHETRASCPMKTQQLTDWPRTLTCSIVLLVYTFSWTSAYYGNNSYFSTSAVKTIGFGRANLQAMTERRLYSPPDGTHCQHPPAAPYGHLLPLHRRIYANAHVALLDPILTSRIDLGVGKSVY